MPKKRVTFETVKTIGLALPGAEEGTVYGSPALKVGGQMFACIAINRSVDPNTLAIRVAFDARDELIAEDPATYYVTDHYVDYPCVLVRMDRVHPDALPDLLQMAWRFVSARARKRKTPASRHRRRAVRNS
jgi:hypothetical protein